MNKKTDCCNHDCNQGRACPDRASQVDPSMALPSKPTHVHTVDCFVEGTQVCGMGQDRPAAAHAAKEGGAK